MNHLNTTAALAWLALAFGAVHIAGAQPAVYGAIGDKWNALGREHGPLGAALTDEADAPHGGRFNRFQHGYIYWHPTLGAFAVWGAIGEKHQALGGVQYGYPITDELGTPDGRGRFNHFRAIHVPGAEDASIYWTPETGAHGVWGAIRTKWAQLGWEGGPLGYPVSSEEDAAGGGRVSRFQAGAIYWHPNLGAFGVWGEIHRAYAESGGPGGALGYPISDEYGEGDFRRSDFQRGHIRWHASGGAEVIIPSSGLTLRFHEIFCVEEVNEESAAEEPYVILTVLDLRPQLSGVPAAPNVTVRRYGVWDNFDGGDRVVDTSPAFWGPNGAGQDVANPGDLAVIVSLLENDNADPGSYAELARTAATAALVATAGQLDPYVRAQQAADAVRNAFNGLDLPVPFALDDDHVATELFTLKPGDLSLIGRRDRLIAIRNSEGVYNLTIRLERH